jgi:hypothetical protein
MPEEELGGLEKRKVGLSYIRILVVRYKGELILHEVKKSHEFLNAVRVTKNSRGVAPWFTK